MFNLESLEARVLLSAMPSLKAPHGHLPTVGAPPVYDGHVTIVSGVQNVWAPDPTDFGATWKLDTTNPSLALYGPDNTPSLSAIHQGQLADCYILAGIGAQAYSHPDKLKALITYDGWGFAVTWTDPYSGSKLIVHTSATLSQAWQVNNGEAYWEVLEKTFAFFRTWNGKTSTNTMDSINYGWPDVGLKQLQAGPVTYPRYYDSTPMQVLVVLQNALAKNQPITYITLYNAPTMVQNHVYTVVSVDLLAMTVTSYNPWGFFDTRSIDDFLINGSGSALAFGS